MPSPPHEESKVPSLTKENGLTHKAKSQDPSDQEDDKERSAKDPPFTLKTLSNAIPAECFQPSVGRSLLYYVQDLVLVSLLYYLFSLTPQTLPYLIPFWLCQGLMFWALFVTGHDCGHGSFSNSPLLNGIIGHLAHAPLLVPFYPWAYTHRLHHGNTGNVAKEEVYRALTETSYKKLPWNQKIARFEIFLLGFPIYLLYRDVDHQTGGNHFDPWSGMFPPVEKEKAKISVAANLGFLLILGCVAIFKGIWFVTVMWFVPWVNFVVWISLVTYLHHTDVKTPWYSAKEWTFLKGALSTVDRDYGMVVNYVHHNIETHVAHHLFSNIPHYHLLEATKAIKPILGKYYMKEDGILQGLWDSYRNCRFISDAPNSNGVHHFIPQQ
jgi:omega-3 fatty acid desaturase (delta-15 desaturase)